MRQTPKQLTVSTPPPRFQIVQLQIDTPAADWGVIDADDTASSMAPGFMPVTSEKKTKKPFIFNNLFTSTKTKLYNLAKPSMAFPPPPKKKNKTAQEE